MISTDKGRLQLDVIHKYLSEESYWAQGRTLEDTQKAIENSICFGVYRDAEQAGFARVITDKATFAYLGDVFILPGYQKKGLSKRLMEAILADPELQNLRRWILATKDAHGLYAQYGFTPLKFPERWMERPAPWAY
ncbi:MAG TPA: GNAT family N-acetyltransferase [Pyrinomonadaceae bacterium]|nr:GNAT family N-acetyltransferase [Pyrinomonadaceae bacterium]